MEILFLGTTFINKEFIEKLMMLKLFNNKINNEL